MGGRSIRVKCSESVPTVRVQSPQEAVPPGRPPLAPAGTRVPHTSGTDLQTLLQSFVLTHSGENRHMGSWLVGRVTPSSQQPALMPQGLEPDAGTPESHLKTNLKAR